MALVTRHGRDSTRAVPCTVVPQGTQMILSQGPGPPQTLSALSSPSVLEPEGQSPVSAEEFAGEKAATGRASWPPVMPVQGPGHSKEHHQVCMTLSLPGDT